MADNTVLKVENLKKYFPIKAGVFSKTVGHVKAVDGVSFTIDKGETLGLVGESGCGKSTTGRAILRLFEKTDGNVYFEGKDIFALKKKELRDLRPKMQMIFQDPYSSLNPRLSVDSLVGEALLSHKLCSKDELPERVAKTIERCGLARYHMKRYPHEFSGGQRQRIGIARALAVQPDFIVCDEPISALDVSIQAQVINMLEELQEEFGLTYLFIAHDLSMVKHISTHIGVMYLGQMVEKGPADDVYMNPKHPYTKALLSAVPIPDPKVAKANKRIVLEGDIPSPIDPPPGCRFKGRCKDAMKVCSEINPELKEVEPGHFVACHLYK